MNGIDGPDVPLCPVCGSTDRPPNLRLLTGAFVGIECLGCNTVFSGHPGEVRHPDNQRRRALWAETTRRRST